MSPKKRPEATAPKYCYNLVGVEYTYVEGQDVLRPGKQQIRVELAYDGGGPCKGGDLALFVDGRIVGTGRLDKTQAFLFSPNETCDVGNDTGTPVSQDYPARQCFQRRGQLGANRRGRERQGRGSHDFTARARADRDGEAVTALLLRRAR